MIRARKTILNQENCRMCLRNTEAVMVDYSFTRSGEGTLHLFSISEPTRSDLVYRNDDVQHARRFRKMAPKPNFETASLRLSKGLILSSLKTGMNFVFIS